MEALIRREAIIGLMSPVFCVISVLVYIPNVEGALEYYETEFFGFCFSSSSSNRSFPQHDWAPKNMKAQNNITPVREAPMVRVVILSTGASNPT